MTAQRRRREVSHRLRVKVVSAVASQKGQIVGLELLWSGRNEGPVGDPVSGLHEELVE